MNEADALLKGLNLLIEEEQDTVDYSNLINKIKAVLDD